MCDRTRAAEVRPHRNVHIEDGKDVILHRDGVSWQQLLPVANDGLEIVLRPVLTGSIPIGGSAVDRPTPPWRGATDGPGGESHGFPTEQVKPAHPRVLRV